MQRMIGEVTKNFLVNAKPNIFVMGNWTGKKGGTRLLNNNEIMTRNKKL
jgi:hypothetical protein